VSQRSFEGYQYGVPLEAEFYGNAYRAYAPSGAEVRLLAVAPTFTAHQEFAATFISRGKLLIGVEHPNIVRTHAVGRDESGGLIVVTDAVSGRVRLEELLGGVADSQMRALPRPVAVAVAAALLDGLAAAHERSIVHGALHPRSVVIDGQGTVKIDDFAVGRALATWSERDSAASFVKAFGGFLAPELAQGARPDASTDVYGAAALVLAVTTGRTAAVALAQGVLPPAVTAVLARALDTNRLHRYANTRRLRDALTAAWSVDGWSRATPEELCAHLERRRHRTEANLEQDEALEQDTEDVLSFLGDIATPPPAAPELVDAVNSMLAELEDDEPTAPPTPPAPPADRDTPAPAPRDTPAPARSRIPRAASADLAMAALADLDDLEPAPRAASDSSPPLPGSPGRTPSENVTFSAVPGDDDDDASDSFSRRRDTMTPLPRPIRPSSEDIAFSAIPDLPSLGDDDDEPASQRIRRPSSAATARRASSSQSLSRADSSPSASRAGSRTGEQKKLPRRASASGRMASQDAATPRPAKKKRAGSKARPSGSMRIPTPAASAVMLPPPIDMAAPELALRKRRGPASLLWLLLVVAGAGTLVWVVRNQIAMREQADEQARANEARQQELLRAHLNAQPRSGRIAVESEPSEAAVWMLLGRTPLETDALSTAMVHELRVELEGHQPQDVRVAGTSWRGEDDARHAEVSARLAPGARSQPLPAYPPEPPPEAMQGLSEGQGPVHVTSEPPGAQVWLLVGITPGVEITATAGAEYELKVVKDGYLPGIVVVRAADWQKAEGQRIAHSIKLQRRPRKR
jgi:serine/threonine protein kinase